MESLMPTFLMTDPALYDVAYKINPWMRPKVWDADPAANRRAARAAWEALKSALESHGGRVHTIPGAPGLPDMVFPANAAVVLDRKALIANFRHPERAGEGPAFLAAFEGLKAKGLVDKVAPIEGVFQEGAGDCIWDAGRRLFWVGDGPRSSPEAAPIIARHFGQQVVRLPLATERYYHLDTCFCPLPGGEILYYPPALTAEATRRLRDIVPGHLLIEATPADAEAFCVNAVAIGRTVIMARPTPCLRMRLTEQGYDVVGLDLDPFLLSGGGAFCMTLRLDLASVRAPIALSA
jgi:N-dimethylarginine dimethylaminohydrolase